MQVREQGRQVQLVRAPYDPVKKRCVQKVIYTFKRPNAYLSDDINRYLSADEIKNLSASLTEDEQTTLSDWIKAKMEKETANARRIYILHASVGIIKSADAISVDGIDADQAVEIWDAIDQLAKALCKAGHPKVSAKALAKPTAETGQGDLLV